MPTVPKVLATAALLALATSCVSYSRYEATALVADKYRALAQARRDSIDLLHREHLDTYRENEALAHDRRLLRTELHATRAQYAQLQVANADVVARYDRSLALSAFENEGHASARHRLTEAAMRREADAVRATERAEAMGALVEELAGDRRDLEALLREYDAGAGEGPYAPAERWTPPPRAGSLTTPQGTLSLEELRTLERFSTSGVAVQPSRAGYVVRVAESLCFASRRAPLSATGRAVFGELGAILRSRPELDVLVHADSRQEGTHVQVVELERRQANAVVDALARAGVAPRRLHTYDDAEWAGRDAGEGSLAGGLDGELVLLLQAAAGPQLSALQLRR